MAEDEPLDFEELDFPSDELTDAVPDDADVADEKSKKKKKISWGFKKKKRKKADEEDSEAALDEEIDEDSQEDEDLEKPEEDETKGRKLWEAITNAEPYTVMLGLALLAIVIAVFCLLMELRSYDYNIKAKGSKRSAAITQFEPHGQNVAGRAQVTRRKRRA